MAFASTWPRALPAKRETTAAATQEDSESLGIRTDAWSSDIDERKDLLEGGRGTFTSMCGSSVEVKKEDG